MNTSDLNRREHAILRAVAANRAVLLASCAPDLLIDGCWCDHTAVSRLITEGWIRPARPAAIGEHVPAQLTEAAFELLGIPHQQSA